MLDSSANRDAVPKTVLNRTVRALGVAILTAIAYFLSAGLGYLLVARPAGVAVIWPPSGLILAVLLLAGKRDWPVVLTGAFLGGLAADLASGQTLPVAIAAAIANGAEVFTAAWLLARFIRPAMTLANLREVVGLIVGAAMISNAVTALLGAAVLKWGSGMPFEQAWFVWWVGDGIGILIITPVILTWAAWAGSPRQFNLQKLLEAILLLAGMALVAQLALGRQPEDIGHIRLSPYMSFPFLFWAALRFGPLGAATATLVLSAVTIWNTSRGLGPFAQALGPGTNQVLEAYAYLFLASLSSLIPAAILREREAAQSQLAKSEEHYRTVADSAADAILTIDDHSRILFANPATEKIFGYAPAEILGKSLTLLMPDYFRELHKTALARYLTTGTRHINWRGVSLAGLHRNQHEFPVEISFSETIKDGQHLFTGFVRDVTERKQAEEVLRKSGERYRLLFENNPKPMWVFDQESLNFMAVNQAAIEHYGYTREEFLGMTIKDIRPAEDIPALSAHLSELGSSPLAQRGIWQHKKKDGSLIQVEITGHRLEFDGRKAVIVLADDITEKLILQQQLQQSQKMQAIGQLAAGVAHDFNNLLGVILGYSELVSRRLEGEPALRVQILEIQHAGERAAALTRQLLAFSRQQILQPAVLDLNSLVGDVEKLLLRLLTEDIELVINPSEGLGRVMADAGQIEQVIMNLVVNARDAMPARGGRILIETRNVQLDESYAKLHTPVAPGEYVMLAVSDTGIGMDAATQARIFEPFFTTKRASHGTGLGLATAYGIVKQSNGFIWVYSEPGRGTTFKVYLPRVEKELEPPRIPPRHREVRGTETVLLVEDADSLRELACEVLESEGYKVLSAPNGARALEIAEEHRSEIHLLVTDVIMPVMSGRELAERLTENRPALKILYVSGYTGDAIAQRGVLEPGVAFLSKPYSPTDLLQKVRDVLDETTSAH